MLSYIFCTCAQCLYRVPARKEITRHLPKLFLDLWVIYQLIVLARVFCSPHVCLSARSLSNTHTHTDTHTPFSCLKEIDQTLTESNWIMAFDLPFCSFCFTSEQLYSRHPRTHTRRCFSLSDILSSLSMIWFDQFPQAAFLIQLQAAHGQRFSRRARRMTDILPVSLCSSTCDGPCCGHSGAHVYCCSSFPLRMLLAAWLLSSEVQHSTHSAGIKGEASRKAGSELRNVCYHSREIGGKKGRSGQRHPGLWGWLQPGLTVVEWAGSCPYQQRGPCLWSNHNA